VFLGQSDFFSISYGVHH